MFIINITVNADVNEEKQAEMFPVHSEWLKKHFQAGDFLMLGPYLDTDAHAGVIFAHAEDREKLQQILRGDCYYPDFARYEIREFMPKLISKSICKVVEA